MGQELKSGPGIVGFADEASSGQDRVWWMLIGRITEYQPVILSWQTSNFWVVSCCTSVVYIWNWSSQQQYWVEESLAFFSLEKWLLTLNCKLGIAFIPQTVLYGVRYCRLQTLGSGLGQIPVPSLVGVIEITVPELCKFFAPQTLIFWEWLRVFGWPLILNQEKFDVCKCTVNRFYSFKEMLLDIDL